MTEINNKLTNELNSSTSKLNNVNVEAFKSLIKQDPMLAAWSIIEASVSTINDGNALFIKKIESGLQHVEGLNNEIADWPFMSIARSLLYDKNGNLKKLADNNNLNIKFQQLGNTNKEVEAVRDLLDNSSMAVRQQTNLFQTQLSNSVQNGLQIMQAGSKMMQLLTQLTDKIAQAS